MIPLTSNNEAIFQLLRAPFGGKMLFNHLRSYKVLQVGILVVLSLMKVCDVLLGTPGVSLDRVFPNRKTESSNLNISRRSLTTTTSYVSRRCMGRTNVSRLFKCWLRDLGFLVLSFLEMKNAGGSATCSHKDLLPEDAMITCQGREHIVNVQSGRQSLVTVNVHFEPELTLRQLRERLRLINPHWPSYPNAVGIILGDFNICEPEEGRFNVWNQTFTDGDPRKTAIFHSFFHTFLRWLNLDYTRRDSTALGIGARFSLLLPCLRESWELDHSE